jgi:hypothetical protein
MGKKITVFLGLGLLVFFLTLIIDALLAMALDSKTSPMPSFWIVSIALLWVVVFAETLPIRVRFFSYLKGVGVFLACYLLFPLATGLIFKASPGLFLSNLWLMAFFNRGLPGLIAIYFTYNTVKKT